MAGVPQVYRKSNESSIASYNFTDIAEGTGIVLFNGLQTAVSGATLFYLSQNKVASNLVESTGNPALNFPFTCIPFNLPKVVKGTSIIRFSVCTSDANLNQLQIGYRKIYPDGSAVDISPKAITVYFNNTAQNITTSLVIPETHFKKGEALQLYMERMLGANQIIMAHDPINRVGTHFTTPSLTPTMLEALVPFKLDL